MDQYSWRNSVPSRCGRFYYYHWRLDLYTPESADRKELFQRFSELVVSGDKKATKIVDELEKDKRSGNVPKPREVIDKRSKSMIYDLIEENEEGEKDE